MSYIGNTPVNQNFVAGADQFSGTGSQTVFTLSRNVNTVFDMFVTVSNVPQDPFSAYTVSGSTLTFDSAPPSGTGNIDVVYRATNVQYFVPSPLSVSTPQIVDNSITTAKLAAGAVIPADLSTGGPYWDSSGNVGIGTTTMTRNLNVSGSGAAVGVNLNNSGTSGRSYSIFSTNSSAATVGSLAIFDDTAGSYRAIIDSSGNLLVNKTSGLGSAKFVVEADTTTANPMTVSNSRSTAATDYSVLFYRNATLVGSIQTTLSATSYVTTSDYRLKENVQPMTGALAKVAALKPVTYTWKSTGVAAEGFIAHELAEVVPDAVTGEKDAINEDGSIKPQGIDTSFLVATLTAAIQELKAEVDQLRAQLEAK